MYDRIDNLYDEAWGPPGPHARGTRGRRVEPAPRPRVKAPHVRKEHPVPCACGAHLMYEPPAITAKERGRSYIVHPIPECSPSCLDYALRHLNIEGAA